jgi:hypothetical protein
LQISRKEKVVYTAISGGYDDLKHVAVADADTDYIVYSDDPALDPPAPWIYRPITTLKRSPRVTARWYKILPHRHLAEYRYSFWVDGAFELPASLTPLFDQLIATSHFSAFRHPVTNCVYEEAEAVKQRDYDDPQIVDLQMEYYRRRGYPAHDGLIASGVMFRSHHNPLVIAAMEEWWRQVRLFSHRDQLSGNFTFRKLGLAVGYLQWDMPSNPYFRWLPHPVMRPRQEEVVNDEVDWLRQAAIETRTGLRRLREGEGGQSGWARD